MTVIDISTIITLLQIYQLSFIITAFYSHTYALQIVFNLQISFFLTLDTFLTFKADIHCDFVFIVANQQWYCRQLILKPNYFTQTVNLCCNNTQYFQYSTDTWFKLVTRIIFKINMKLSFHLSQRYIHSIDTVH